MYRESQGKQLPSLWSFVSGMVVPGSVLVHQPGSLNPRLLGFMETSLVIFAQVLSCVWLFTTPWTAACQASLSITNSWNLPKLMCMSRSCHPTISSSVVPFSSCLQSFPASGSSPRRQLFASGGQSIGASSSASVLPMIFSTDFH